MSKDKPRISRSAVLEAKLEASEANLKVEQLTQRVRVLEGVIEEQAAILKENTGLLRKQRLPPRPFLNSTSKLLIACKQSFKCKNPDGTCPRYKLGDGTFGEDLFEIDHIQAYSRSGLHRGNLHAICSACHAKRTRKQIAEREARESDSECED
jgi:hypothetical protein